MTNSDIGLLLTICSIVFGFGSTIMFLKQSVSTLKDDIKKLADKVEQHNNFGLKIAKMETRLDILERK